MSLLHILGAGGLVGAAAQTEPYCLGEVTGDVDGTTTTTDVSLTGLSLQAGDLLVMLTGADFGQVTTYNTPPVDLEVSPGWFSLFFEDATSANAHILAYYCHSTPPSTVRIRGPSGSTEDAPYIIQAWRGVDPRILDARSSDTGWSTGTGTSPDPPAVTTVTDDAVVIAFMVLDDDDDTISTWPSGYTDTAEANTGRAQTNGSATVALASKRVTSAGSENPGAFTVSGGGDQYATCSLALMPDQDVVSGWAIQEVGRAVYCSGASGTTYNLPSGLQENDLVVILSCAINNYGGSGDPMNSSGWTVDISSNNYRWNWYKKMGATPDTTVDIDNPGFGAESALLILAFRGVDTTTPIDVATGYNSSSYTAPSITTATNNALVIRFGFCFGGNDSSFAEWPIGYAGHMTMIGDQFDTSNQCAASCCYTQQNTAGATGAVEILRTATGGTNSTGTMALRPA